MKATRASIGRAVDQPDGKIRFYLFYGPDEAQSRALGARLVEALGAVKFAVSAGAVAGVVVVVIVGSFHRADTIGLVSCSVVRSSTISRHRHRINRGTGFSR